MQVKYLYPRMSTIYKSTINDPIIQLPELASGLYTWKVFLQSESATGKIIVE